MAGYSARRITTSGLRSSRSTAAPATAMKSTPYMKACPGELLAEVVEGSVVMVPFEGRGSCPSMVDP